MKYLDRKFKTKVISKTCDSKAKFRSKERAIRRAQELREKTGKPFRAYRCEANHYHLTSHNRSYYNE